MKRLLYLFIPFIFGVLFIGLDLKSFADPNYAHSTGYNTFEVYLNIMNEHPEKDIFICQGSSIISYLDGNPNGPETCFLKLTSQTYVVDGTNVPIRREQYIWSNNYTGTDYNGNLLTDFTGYRLYDVTNNYIFTFVWYSSTFGQVSTSVHEGIVFSSYNSAYGFSVTGNTTQGGAGSGGGSTIVSGSVSNPINWGDNGQPNQSGSIPNTYDIPAPQFEPVYDAYGNITHSIKFTNQWVVGPGQGDRGLFLMAFWVTADNFQLTQTNGVFNNDYKVTYDTMLDPEDTFTIFGVPTKEEQINVCPTVFNFDTNQIVMNHFNMMLSEYPVADRTITTKGLNTDVRLKSDFKDYLSQISCPYNTLGFVCYYYQKMPDGTFQYGPKSSGHFDFPAQGSVYNMQVGLDNGGTWGGMAAGDGGGLSGSDGSGWDINYGNGNTIYTGGDIDVSSIKNGMQSLFGMLGDFPQFIGQCFNFLPSWVLTFIALSITLLIAIGLVKTLL